MPLLYGACCAKVPLVAAHYLPKPFDVNVRFPNRPQAGKSQQRLVAEPEGWFGSAELASQKAVQKACRVCSRLQAERVPHALGSEGFRAENRR